MEQSQYTIYTKSYKAKLILKKSNTLFHSFYRHRMVNEALSQELQNGIHALSIVVSLKKKIMIHVQTVCDL